MDILSITVDESIQRGGAVKPEQAVKFKIHPELKRDDYIRFVHELIGGYQIHSVYENGEIFKVYLTDEKLVAEVVGSGKTLRGVIPEYNVPPGLKITLTNVDPVVPDDAILEILRSDGCIHTKLLHERVSTKDIFSHIITSTRYFYMSPNKTLPHKITIEHEDQLFEIDLKYEPEVHDVESNSSSSENSSNIDQIGQLISSDSN